MNTAVKKTNKKKAFTLVEILVVIAVIGILFTVFIPKIDFAADKAKETGVKSDLRSYILAAEQVMRENSGLGFVTTGNETKDVIEQLNLYLDDAMDFDDSTALSAMNDPWNEEYKVTVSATASTNNGKILFETGGKDQAINGTGDYIALVTVTDGVIKSATNGFSSNIGSISGVPAAGTAANTAVATMTID